MKLCPVLEYLRWDVMKEDGNANSFELSQEHMNTIARNMQAAAMAGAHQ